MSSRGATHPYIGFIVGELKEVGELLGAGYKGPALAKMVILLHSVGPDARETTLWIELEAYLKKTVDMRRAVKDTDPLVLQAKQDAFDYKFDAGFKAGLSKLWLIMWENGYMYQKTFFGGVKPDSVDI